MGSAFLFYEVPSHILSHVTLIALAGVCDRSDFLSIFSGQQIFILYLGAHTSNILNTFHFANCCVFF